MLHADFARIVDISYRRVELLRLIWGYRIGQMVYAGVQGAEQHRA